LVAKAFIHLQTVALGTPGVRLYAPTNRLVNEGINDMTIKIAIAGINGRMGSEVLTAADEAPDVVVVAGLVRVGAGPHGRGVPTFERVEELPPGDVLIDFTTAGSTLELATAAADRGIPFVSGVTGLSESQLCALRELGTRIPVLHARNFSLGLNALLRFLPELVQSLDGYDIEIVEAHHRYKSDAPSGTALALAEAIGGASTNFVYGREGVAPRKAGEIGVHAVRGGGNTGEHTVLIMDDGEEIRISHRLLSRRALAIGALKAAGFLVSQPAGFYEMSELKVLHS
jgi:4-hydroxy-tetrahydrodipicolinate reductase